MDENEKRVIIYCRESRDDYGENFERIETQRDILINYCKNSNKNEDLEINKADVKMILKIIDEYRLSINDTYSLINKYESLIDLNDNYDYIGEPEEFVYNVTDDYELENKKGRSR